MYEKDLDDLVAMSVRAGNLVDYVQAGGGNTSVKFADGYMAIKASGYFLKEMTTHSGFVVVSGEKMKAYHYETQDEDIDFNKESMEIAMSTIKQINNEVIARPSVEVGFHSILDKFVLHLHPVYVNVLMCSTGGVEKALNITKACDLDAVAIPYTMPGYELTVLIAKELATYQERNGRKPKIIFLENHGVITTGETREEAEQLMDRVNEAIRDELGLPKMPVPGIKPYKDGFCSTCNWMIDVVKENEELVQAVRYEAIYPDQLVYTANEMSVDGSEEGKIVIANGQIVYHAKEKEAMALEEVMVALFYVYYYIKKSGLAYKKLDKSECAKVLGWDSEKYRKSLMET